MAASMNGLDTDGFWLEGLGDYSDVVIRHSDLPGYSWRLMIPEYGWVSDSVRAREVDWPEREGKRVCWRWEAERAVKLKAQNDFWGSAEARSPEEIEYHLTYKNLGEQAWGAGQSCLVCLISGGVPEFQDYEGHRTFVYVCDAGSFVDIDEVQGGIWADHRMWGGRVPAFAGLTRPAVERLMVKISKNGRYALGIATDSAVGVSCNHQIRMSCIHSNPHWGPLEPGEEKTVNGKIYLVESDCEGVLRRYRADFGMLCR